MRVIPTSKTSKLKAWSVVFVAVSEADVDANKRPITVKNAEKATSMFYTVMVSCWHPRLSQKRLQKAACF